MMFSKTGTAILILVIMTVITPSFSRSQELKARLTKYVRGRIYNIDWAGSKITTQWFYSTDKKLAEDKMTFITPSGVQVFTDKEKIFKDVRPAGITDLIKGDHVIIGYRYGAKKGELEAVTIRVLERDKPIPP